VRINDDTIVGLLAVEGHTRSKEKTKYGELTSQPLMVRSEKPVVAEISRCVGRITSWPEFGLYFLGTPIPNGLQNVALKILGEEKKAIHMRIRGGRNITWLKIEDPHKTGRLNHPSIIMCSE
jgi:hypothetical protein